MRRMYELLAATHRSHHHIRISAALRSDLRWWATFIEDWNGASFLQEFGSRRPAFEFWTDASGGFGCGALWGLQWLQAEWLEVYEGHSSQREGDSITMKELLPIVLACVIWGRVWTHW